jgi:hypothetical protein
MKKTIIISIFCFLFSIYFINAVKVDNGLSASATVGEQTSKYCLVMDIKTPIILGNLSELSNSETWNNCLVYSRSNHSLLYQSAIIDGNYCNMDYLIQQTGQYSVCVGTTGSYTVGYNNAAAAVAYWNTGYNTSAVNLVAQEEITAAGTWLGLDKSWIVGWKVFSYTVYSITPALTVVFNEQKPSDLSISTIFNVQTNISYNISNAPVNLTSALFYKANNTVNNIYYCDNATNCYSGYQNKDYSFASGNTYTWALNDNEIVSGSYLTAFNNYNVTHTKTAITQNNFYYKCNISNISNVYPKLLELDFDTTNNFRIGTIPFGTNTKNIFYTGLNFTNHTHFDKKSDHTVIPIPNINVNNNWFFVERLNGIGYVDTITTGVTSNTCMLCNNNNACSNTNILLDMHVHWNSTFYYYANITDGYNQNTISSLRSDLFDIGGLAPTSPIITVTNRNENETSNNVTIEKGTSLNNYAVTFQNLSLYNASNDAFIRVNQTINFTLFNYYDLTYNNSYYVIGLNCDENRLCSIGQSDTFSYINYSEPITPVTPPANVTVTNSSVTVYFADDFNQTLQNIADAITLNATSVKSGLDNLSILLFMVIIFAVISVIGYHYTNIGLIILSNLIYGMFGLLLVVRYANSDIIINGIGLIILVSSAIIFIKHAATITNFKKD